MITYFDLVQKNEFRDYVSDRIAKEIDTTYRFPSVFPSLYRYRPLSQYTVNDILSNNFTMTAIGEFNDIFDGAFHQYGSNEEKEKAAEAQWEDLEACRVAANLPAGLLTHDNIVETYKEHLKIESRLKFRELDYLGTLVTCLSTSKDSTLMWSHYADSNRGICIEYDFNKLAPNDLLRKTVFPVAYSKTPIQIEDLIRDKENQVYQYALDAAVLCAALNKSKIWEYEKEWRVVWITAFSPNERRHISIGSFIQPTKIYFGYHFLKQFFYYDFTNANERELCQDNLKRFYELLNYIRENNIGTAIMVPSIGSFRLKACDISVEKLESFMHKNFKDNSDKSIRYYYVLHDYLMDMVETEDEIS